MKMQSACAGGLLALVASGLVAAAGEDDRLTLSANGSTLTDVSGGGGGSIGWLHNFSPNAIVGAAAEYQTLADSEWSFGSLSFSVGRGAGNRRTTFYADGHVGSGDDNGRSWDYATWVAGLYQNVSHRVSIQLEDKQVDIDRTHGNLPKVGLQVVWSPSLISALSYAHSVSGNLGTRLGTLRLDYYGKGFNLIVGGAGGKASPDIVNIRGVVTPGATLREGFAGIGKPFSRADVTLLGDYIQLGDTERFTLTLNCTVHLRGRGGSR
jgi:hypothetical protein